MRVKYKYKYLPLFQGIFTHFSLFQADLIKPNRSVCKAEEQTKIFLFYHSVLEINKSRKVDATLRFGKV